jgi:hypothetical protein
MKDLLHAQMATNIDLMQVKRYLHHLKPTDWRSETNYFDMQSIIYFTVDGKKYKLVIPLDSKTSQIDYYIKDQLPELLL